MSSGTTDPNPRLPLAGGRIISVEQYGAGPWGTMFLADLGAEIIKIENPDTGGDVARYVPPYTGTQDSVYFQSFNRNKKSITLNLQHPETKAILHKLVVVSDAVFNNLRGDLPSKLGLDYESLKAVKPAIVCCSLSAFGRHGARAAEPGYDYTMQAYAGWMSITGEPDTPPQKSGLSLVDYSGGVMSVLGMVSAILGARVSGRGSDVDVSLFDNAISHLSYVGAWHLTKGYEPQRWPDSSHPSQVPSQVLPSKDGWLVVMCAKEKFYQNLVTIMGSPELAEDPRFNSFACRLENREVLGPILISKENYLRVAGAAQGAGALRTGEQRRGGASRPSGGRERTGAGDGASGVGHDSGDRQSHQGRWREDQSPIGPPAGRAHRSSTAGPRKCHRRRNRLVARGRSALALTRVDVCVFRHQISSLVGGGTP